MGTSKGYIAPSTPNWSSAKRGVSGYVSNPSDYNLKEAVSKFAKAMNADETISNRAFAAFSNFVSFVSSSKSNGFSQALNNLGKNYIADLPPEEVFNELINAFSEGNTVDDIIANNCISEALEVLEIKTFEDLSNIKVNNLIKELVCQFAKQKFAQMFSEQIQNKCANVITANKRLEEIQNYIYYTLKDNLTSEILSQVNPLDLANEEIIIRAMKDAFDILGYYYDE